MSLSSMQSSREMLLQLSLKDLSLGDYTKSRNIVCNQNWQKLFKVAKNSSSSQKDLFQFQYQPFMPSYLIWAQFLKVDAYFFNDPHPLLVQHSLMLLKPPLQLIA